MDSELLDQITESFDQASSRGIPASETTRRLAVKFDIREERVVDALREAERIATASFGGSTIVWSADQPNEPASHDLERQLSAVLLQAGINLALSRGVISNDYLESQPADKVMHDLFSHLAAADDQARNNAA